MIQVKKGNSLLVVTTGAYHNFYKHLGYEPVDAPESHEKSEQENAQHHEETQRSEESAQTCTDEETSSGQTEDGDEEEDTEDEVDLSEIPLAELSHSQLFEYADQLGLEYEGTPGKKEMQSLIRAHLKS
jgi:hypothetical protein